MCWQFGQFYIVGDGGGVVVVYVFDYVVFGFFGEWIGQWYVFGGQLVDCVEIVDEMLLDWLQYLEVEIVDLMVVGGFGEIVVVMFGCCGDFFFC